MVLKLGVAIPMGVIRYFSRGRERYFIFVRNPFAASVDVMTFFYCFTLRLIWTSVDAMTFFFAFHVMRNCICMCLMTHNFGKG